MDGSFIDKSVTYEAKIIVGFTNELRGHYTVKFFSSTNTESITNGCQGYKLITPFEIIAVVTIIRISRGPRWQGCRGYHASWNTTPRRIRGHGDCPGDAKHLANVHVSASPVQLGVVRTEEGGVDIVV
jgi:hypothetical protein